MKKLPLLCIFLFYLLNSLTAQEFSFQMYFEDALGNKDTLTIGYDINGSRDTINTNFGEENIAHIPFDEVFDVRITNQIDIYEIGNYNFELFHSKHKIIKYYCDGNFNYFELYPIVNINIHAINWPVTASWNSVLFNIDCLIGSLFTPVHPVGWWDSGSPNSNFWRVVLEEQNSIEFSENYPGNWEDFPDGWPNYYVDDSGKPISNFWVAFADSSIISLNTDYFNVDNNIVLYPNPTHGKFTISNCLHDQCNVIIYDFTGKVFEVYQYKDDIDLSHLNNGIYILKITFSNGRVYHKKLIKVN
ncbi:MAG: T9SS type A sorting domain-containing protein [Bacteroidetes bacterium]|nr:T9SS type A sorting domain-containing protein [Bacteroidota bacterium]